MKKRIFSFALMLVLLFSMAAPSVMALDLTSVANASTEKNETRVQIDNAFADYLVNSVELANDGELGIPVSFDVYVRDVNTLHADTAIAFYVINTNTERVGTDSDLSIIADLLSVDLSLSAEQNRAEVKDDAMIVIVVDYFENALATTPGIDWSMQKFHEDAEDGSSIMTDTRDGASTPLIYNGKRSFVLPAGYSVLRDVEYFDYKQHASDGTLEFIVEIWNEDFSVEKRTP